MLPNLTSKKKKIQEKKYPSCQVLFISLFMLFLSGIVNITYAQNTEYAATRLLIKFKSGVDITESELVKTTINARTVKRFNLIKAELWEFSGSSVDKVIADYKDHPAIEVIEPDYIIRLEDDDSRDDMFIEGKGEPSATIPNDEFFGDLWGMHNTGQSGGTADADIDAVEAWYTETGDNVIVGIIDTGIDWDHEDLQENMWTNPGEIPGNHYDDDGNGYVDDVYGYDFFNHDSEPMDDHGHGTHVAGTIAARGDNEIGVVGVMWNARLMALKFLGADGGGYASGAIEAIEYSINMGVNITNNSWGGYGFSRLLLDVVALAGAHEQLFIASAGNHNINNDVIPQYPASFDLANIISVAATDHNDEKAVFQFGYGSNYGQTSVDLGAPGKTILSCIPNNSYANKNGTSMATPHVSGVAGLLVSNNPGISMVDVKARILASVDPIASMQNITVTGGRLNAYNALNNSSGGSDELIVTPSSYTLALDMGSVVTEELNIGVFGNQNMNWSITDNASWLSVSPTSGTTSPGNPSSVTVTINTTGLAIDMYNSVLNITASTAPEEQDGSEQIIESTMDIPIKLAVVSEQKFTGNTGDRFGFSTAADDYFVITGSPIKNGYTGEVKIYKWDTNNDVWAENATLVAPDGEYGDRFGFAVDIEVDVYAPSSRVIVGAYGDDESYQNVGAAYVFEYDYTNDIWTQVGDKIVPNDGFTADFFGWSVAIQGSYAIIGAPWDDDNNENTSGSVYAFAWTGSTWNQIRKINRGTYAKEGGKFGYSVAYDSPNLFVGEPYASNGGRVEVYKTSDWSHIKSLTLEYPIDYSGFGWSVDVQNFYAIIGAPFYGESGAAFSSYKSGNWSNTTPLSLSDGADGDQFGWSVSVFGDYGYALVGSKWDDDKGSESGSAYMYSYDWGEDKYTEEYKLTASDGSSNDWFGRSVALCTPDWYKVYAFVGADGSGANAGSVYFYEVPEWTSEEGIASKQKQIMPNQLINQETKAMPVEFQLYQNYPNPFNPTTKIKYSLKKDVRAVLKIYNILGNEIRTLVNEFEEAGVKTVEWDGTNNIGMKVPSGIYIYNIKAGNFRKTRKMVLIK